MKNNNTISEDKLKELKKMVREQLSRARHKILTHYPFIGAIGLRMDLIPVRDVRVRTACTDGHDVYFDISFYNSLSPDERIFVACFFLQTLTAISPDFADSPTIMPS